MYIYIYVYVYTCISVNENMVYIYIYMYTNVHTCISTHVYTCISRHLQPTLNPSTRISKVGCTHHMFHGVSCYLWCDMFDDICHLTCSCRRPRYFLNIRGGLQMTERIGLGLSSKFDHHHVMVQHRRMNDVWTDWCFEKRQWCPSKVSRLSWSDAIRSV
jgi:hypothetical protein